MTPSIFTNLTTACKSNEGITCIFYTMRLDDFIIFYCFLLFLLLTVHGYYILRDQIGLRQKSGQQHAALTIYIKFPSM